MKKLIIFTVSIILAIATLAQGPQGFSYQAVIRNSEGQPIADHNVGVKISLQNQTGTTVHYAETHTATTSPQGIISLVIGEGDVIYGSFSRIRSG